MSSVIPTMAQETSLDGIIITTTKDEEKAIESLSGASAVSRDRIDDEFQPDDLPSVLSTVPGVTTSVTARDPAIAINIRGLQDFGRVNVLIEGARQNFQRSGHTADGFFYLEPEMVKSIDITRGPSSTLYGSGAIGGVVAFDLLDADDILRDGETYAVRLRTRYGTNGDQRLGSLTGAMKVGNFDVLAQGNIRRDDPYDDGDGNTVTDSGQETDSFLGKARWFVADGHVITASAIKYQSEFIDRPTATTATRRDSTLDNEQFTLGYKFSREDVPLFDFSAKIYRNTTELDQERISDNSIFEPAGSQRDFNLVTDGFDIANTSRFQFSNIKLAFTVGVDGFRDEVTTNDVVGNGDEFTPSGEREVFGSFAQARLSFANGIDLIGALRYDDYKLEGGDTELSGDRISPKVTIGVTPLQGVTFFATYAEGFRAPSVTETLIRGTHPPPVPFELLPNPNLRPEVAKNVEAGVNVAFDGVVTTGDKFRAKIVGFENKVEDFIDGVFNPFAPPNGEFQYENRNNVTIQGVEFEGVYSSEYWFFSFAAEFIQGEDDETGETLTTVGPNKATTTLGLYAFEGKLLYGVRGNFYAGQKDVDVSLQTAGYSTFDLFARYKFNDNATMNVNVDNVFDKDYRQYFNQSDSPGLNARVGLTLRLGG
ncbi:MAG: TonB-dependent hemoglobin/transferrin/lactoferrin family receptor [Pseudomonadota bacterium]